MQERSYPTSLEELSGWIGQDAPATELRRRLVQFVVLTAISAGRSPISRIAFKGGNALRFMHRNPRSTVDLDFSANDDFPDDADQIKRLFAVVLKTTPPRTQIKTRCQSVRRNPRSLDKTMPTYII